MNRSNKQGLCFTGWTLLRLMAIKGLPLITAFLSKDFRGQHLHCGSPHLQTLQWRKTSSGSLCGKQRAASCTQQTRTGPLKSMRGMKRIEFWYSLSSGSLYSLWLASRWHRYTARKGLSLSPHQPPVHQHTITVMYIWTSPDSTHTHTRTRTHTHTHTHLNKHTYSNTHIWTHTQTHASLHADKHIHTHTYIHKHRHT